MEETPEVFTDLVESWSLVPENWRVVSVVFLLVLATALVAFVVSRVILALERRFQKTDNIWDDVFLHALRKPAVVFVWLQGVYWAAEIAYRYSEAEIFSFNDKLLELGFIWLIVWTILGAIRHAEKVLISPDKVKKPVDYTTLTAIGKLLRAVVVITAVLTAMQSLGYSISGVLAFGGVGGIAVGFAARDLLANFFGGFIVYMDKPFKVGDWVRSPDRNIEGTVEEIGWRITTIRTFDQRPLYVPNAVFSTVAVENPSRMRNRRISETIGVRYGDVHAVREIVNEIRSMLEGHEEIDTERTLIVNFLAFNDSSLDIMVYTFTKTTQWVKFHAVKEDVLLKISDIIESHGAEVAFPSRTLYVPDAVRVAAERAQSSSEHDDSDQAASDVPIKQPTGPGQTTRQGDAPGED
ncbi:mechanosensitive ion channel family protein [uncultured Marinobacter sp.]|uniref:mechanosensitive ion channel family protein n=1 Tax=uncultured Marinobacter sp. TaxID=187379 RepID=UPI0030D811FE